MFNEITKSFTLPQVTSTFKIDLKVFHIDIGTYFAGIFEGMYFLSAPGSVVVKPVSPYVTFLGRSDCLAMSC